MWSGWNAHWGWAEIENEIVLRLRNFIWILFSGTLGCLKIGCKWSLVRAEWRWWWHWWRQWWWRRQGRWWRAKEVLSESRGLTWVQFSLVLRKSISWQRLMIRSFYVFFSHELLSSPYVVQIMILCHCQKHVSQLWPDRASDPLIAGSSQHWGLRD